MKSTTFFATLAAFVSASYAALTINTPSSVVECEPTIFNFSGGTAPYYLTLVPGGQPTAPATKSFPTQNGNSYTWVVDLQSGTSLTAELKDATGALQYSDIFTIQAGTSSSCVNTSVQESGSGSGSASTGASGSTGTGTAASTSSSAKSSATSAPSGGSSGQASGASRLTVSAFGVSTIMGLVGAALF